jgi:hypothetical protein
MTKNENEDQEIKKLVIKTSQFMASLDVHPSIELSVLSTVWCQTVWAGIKKSRRDAFLKDFFELAQDVFDQMDTDLSHLVEAVDE